ncbi:MAG: hypothetical protein Kow0027_30200 [Saprospiraceae bacterium]
MRKPVGKIPNPDQLLTPKGQRGVFLLLFLLVQLLYWPSARAGFVTDYTGLLERLDGAPFSDFLNSFGFPALHPVTNFFLYWFHQCFGVQGLGWHLVHTTLHALNAWMVFRLTAKMMGQWKLRNGSLVALITALLFLAHPYNVEPVVWRVCFNHLFTTLLILGGLWYALRFFEEKKPALLWRTHGLFAIALLTFETALVLPMLLVIFAMMWPERPPLSGHRDRFRQWLLLLAPQLALLACWAALNRYLFGSVVGHYGPEVHLRFYPPEMAATLTKYFLKYLLFWRHWPHGWKEALMQWLDQPAVGWALFLAGLALLTLLLFSLRKIPTRLRLPLAALLAFFAVLLPVSNLYVSWLLYAENDRYGYLASFFFSLALVASLAQWRWRLWQKVLLLVTILSFFAAWQQVQLWKHNAVVQQKVLHSWKWAQAPEVYVLAYPENYRGTPMFRDFSGKDEALVMSLWYLAGINQTGRIYEVAQFNLATPEDGVTVEREAGNVFKVRFRQWGNWWWRRGIGTWNYETPQCRFTVDGNGSIVELLKPAPGAVVVCWDGEAWQALE